MAEQRFLVVRLGSLGDIVHTFPAVAGLRESFPSAEIIWLTHPRWVELVASSWLATEIWPVDSRDLGCVRRVLRKIRGGNWTAAIDYQGLWKSATLPFLGGVAKRIGFSSATIREFGVPVLYTDRVGCRTTHIADQNGELTLRTGAVKAVSEVKLEVAGQLSDSGRFARKSAASWGSRASLIMAPEKNHLSRLFRLPVAMRVPWPTMERWDP